MLLIISDASVLIDVECGGLTSAMFSLPWKFAVPDILFEEELAERHGHLLQFGLISKTMSGDLVGEAYRLRQRYARTSVNDLLALTLAKHEDCQLLTGDTDGRNVLFNHIRIGKLEPSLLSLLLRDIYTHDKPALYFKYNSLNEISDEIIFALDKLFKELQVIYPDDKMMSAIVEWFYAGLRGEELHIFSLVCPDYSVEETGDPNCPYRHTFNQLGNGVGLIAKRVLDAMPLITETLHNMGIKVKFTISMADYEILSKSNLSRLNLTFDEFLEKIERSRIAFKTCHSDVNSTMLTALCDGYDVWRKLYQEYRNRFANNDFGNTNIDEKKLIDMVKTRKHLYERWHGEKPSLSEYIPILLDQSAEYAVVGNIINKKFKNCLILGGDHNVFSNLYSVDKFIPALYLKRFYC